MSEFGKLPEQAEPGSWLRVPYSGHPLSRVDLKVGSGAEWNTCYHDSGDVMVRVKDLRPGNYDVFVRKNDREIPLGTVRIPGKTSGKSSVRIR